MSTASGSAASGGRREPGGRRTRPGLYRFGGPALALLVVGLWTGGTCSLLTDPDARTHLAFITGFDDDDPHVTVPATATAGVPFTVRVRTYGPSGCWSRGETSVLRLGTTVTISPSDHVVDADVCTAVLRVFDHVADITFPDPGEARVVVRGRENGSGDVVTFQFSVTVAP